MHFFGVTVSSKHIVACLWYKCMRVQRRHLLGRGSVKKLVTFWVSCIAYCLLGSTWVLYSWTEPRLMLFYWWNLEGAGGYSGPFFQPRESNFSEGPFSIVWVRTSLIIHSVLQPSAYWHGCMVFCWSGVTEVCTGVCAHMCWSRQKQEHLRSNERQRWKGRAAGAAFEMYFWAKAEKPQPTETKHFLVWLKAQRKVSGYRS